MAAMSYTDPLPPQAVRAHDLAREVPEAMWDEAIDGLVAHATTTTGTCVVDIGSGTGAVGGRLHARGLPVVGVDGNPTMLAALAEQHPDLPVVLGDATDLPIGTEHAALTVMACVLHLIDDWRRALAEAVRVTAPGGVIAVNVGQSGLAGRTGVSRFFLDHVTNATELAPPTGPSDPAQVADELAAQGCEPLAPIRVTGTARRSIADHIFRLEWNPFAWPPGTPQQHLSDAATATRAWAAEQFGGGDLDEPYDTEVTIGFTVFRTP